MTPPSCLASVAPSTATPSTTDISSTGSFDFNHHSHRRFNPLTNSWVLCSPHRTQRPWQGKEEDSEDSSTTSPSFDPKCYLCPGNTRANKTIHRNPDYKDTFVFENDFPAVQQDQPELVVDDGKTNHFFFSLFQYEGVACEKKNLVCLLTCIQPDNKQKHIDSFNPLLQVESVRGQCHVICFSPNHDKTLADMSEQEILPVIDAWIHVYDSLKDKPDINHVQIFENKGAIMGCSNPHPHGQAWSTQDIPQETAQELENMHRYQEKYHRCMLCDYVMTETKTKDTSSSSAGSMNGKAHAVMNGSTHLTNRTSSIPPKSSSTSTTPDGSRIVCENASFLCVVPFWATWPFETMVLAKTHVATLSELNQAQKLDLATILRQLTCRYDNLFKCSFPYSMGIHQAPTDGNREHHETSHLHLHFYPPLLRSATVKKFLVG